MNRKLTRRQILHLATGSVVMPFMTRTLDANTADTEGALIEATHGSNGKRVILLELAGANDGLNTLIPFSDDRYHELRPKLGLKKTEFNTITDDFALHSALQRSMPLWEKGNLALVQGLGYPSPNRSHFESIAIWETGGDGVSSRRDGWITHALEHAYATDDLDAHGVSFGGGMNIFSSDTGTWLSLKSAQQLLNAKDSALLSADNSDGATNNPALALLLERNAQLQRAIGSIRTKLRSNRYKSKIPGRSLGRQLRHVVHLIAAGVDAPVYKVSLNGFDTHANQRVRHQRLLQELATGLSSLAGELQQMDEWSNTLVVTYSEFGRRARENFGGGTDHGTAAPHLVIGGSVNGGLWGDHPDLGNLRNDDLIHTMDYRSVYERLLSDWLAIPENNFADFRDDRLNSLLSA